jgi:NADH dehydrogenase (ubiquinone) 1 alpha subcomplex subunit 13
MSTVQDLPPNGGFPTTIRYQRNIPQKGPSGLVIFVGVLAVMGYGFYNTTESNKERTLLRNEKMWARINLVPLLQAEADRDHVRRLEALTKREAEIMKDVPNWVPMDLKAPVPGMDKNGNKSSTESVPVYYTKRHVAPTQLFLPEESLMKVQSWRGSKFLTKVSLF